MRFEEGGRDNGVSALFSPLTSTFKPLRIVISLTLSRILTPSRIEPVEISLTGYRLGHSRITLKRPGAGSSSRFVSNTLSPWWNIGSASSMPIGCSIAAEPIV